MLVQVNYQLKGMEGNFSGVKEGTKLTNVEFTLETSIE